MCYILLRDKTSIKYWSQFNTIWIYVSKLALRNQTPLYYTIGDTVTLVRGFSTSYEQTNLKSITNIYRYCRVFKNNSLNNLIFVSIPCIHLLWLNISVPFYFLAFVDCFVFLRWHPFVYMSYKCVRFISLIHLISAFL